MTTTRRTAQSAATPVPPAGRLLARPGPPTEPIFPGLRPLGLDPRRDALLYVPSGYRPENPAPFALSLHGAGGNAESGPYPLGDLADAAGLILLSPTSRGRTWDMLLDDFGPDVAFIDRALTAAFAHCAVDPARLAIAGFSDGASYALSLGLANGDLFGAVLAFSPGFANPPAQRGRPRFWISHATGDRVLAIERTSHRIVPRLKQAGYTVVYREYAGDHSVPPWIAREALAWFLGPAAGAAATPGAAAG